MTIPTISEAARLERLKQDVATCRLVTDAVHYYGTDKDQLADDIEWALSKIAALDSAHPAPKEGEAKVITVTWKPDRGNYYVSIPDWDGGDVVLLADYEALQLRLSEAKREVEALKKRILDDNKAYGCELRDPNGTIWEYADSLRSQLKTANELLGEAHRCYFDPGHMEPNTWGTEVAHKLDDYVRTHLNQQSK